MYINTDDDHAYEHLSFIISEFEKAALQSDRREGALIVAQSPIAAMEKMLHASDKVLSKVKDSRKKPTKKDILNDALQIKNKSIELDADLAELFGGEDNPVANYLNECLGCDLRVTFDWQLKPLNLLGGIKNLIKGINEIIDAFALQLDPFKTLEGLCDLLNMLKGLCLPDILIVLLSLKMLLKKYITDAINITLDWTVILGPLLKLIVEGIAALLETIASLLLAPLDCTLTALYAANDIEREARELLAQTSIMANGLLDQATSIGSLLDGSSFDIKNLKDQDVITPLSEKQKWTGGKKTTYPEPPIFGGFNTHLQEGFQFELEPEKKEFTVPIGFEINRDSKLLDAIQDVNFANSTIISKLILPVQEARNYIQGLLSNLLTSLHSVEALVGGGLSVQMGQIGIIMFLKDMISLVMMIIKMLKQNVNVKDWCSFLEENPAVLENALKERYAHISDGLKVDAKEGNKLVLSRGPAILKEISTCSSSRTGPEAALLQQWIQELERKS